MNATKTIEIPLAVWPIWGGRWNQVHSNTERCVCVCVYVNDNNYKWRRNDLWALSLTGNDSSSYIFYIFVWCVRA